MIWGLRVQLYEVFSMYLSVAMSIVFCYMQRHNKNGIIFGCCCAGIFFLLYLINSFGYVLDILLKNIGETDWIPDENIHYLNPISGYGYGKICGCRIKVCEDGKKPKKLNVYINMAPCPEDATSHYKIYYLRTCNTVVGWDAIRVKKEKMNLSRKSRKSK